MTVRRTLSKSDFKLGDDCPAKLYYKKLGYPSKNAENDYLAFLAEGGYLIGAVSKLVYPGGVDLDAELRALDLPYPEMTQRALARTRELMQLDEVTIYEPAFVSGKRLVRVDVLVKQRDRVDLIEVKSKSQDSTKIEWSKDWDPYLDDVAFQCLVVRAACPGMQVTPHLLTPDKSVVATIDHLTSFFELQEHGYSGNFRQIDVRFMGTPELAEQIRTSGLLRTWDVAANIGSRLHDVDSRVSDFEAWLDDDPLVHPRPTIGKHCFKCEYDASDDLNRNGFRECWGNRAEPEPHIRELYQLSKLGGPQNSTANRLIEKGHVHHDDVDESDLRSKSGELGKVAVRILTQIETTRNQTEWLDVESLRDEMQSWSYPLHFIDFETSMSPVPYHSGMRSYQTVPFQWSCHTIAAPGAAPRHGEYLNTMAAYPAVEFLTELRNQLGTQGTVLMWSHYERTQLNGMVEWMRRTQEAIPVGLIDWTAALIDSKDLPAHACELRLVDQMALAVQHWVHPRMKGSVSLKVALPAALAAASPGRVDEWLSAVDLLDPATRCRPDDPYRLLPNFDIAGLESGMRDENESASVTDGVGAMRAYQDMVYGKHMRCAERKRQIQESLLRYCRLDTLAQVIIWEHWRTQCGL